ncbi:hypothetical protein BSLG_010538 [Batrachochytrium salamandrivorans]|nr:hypothetical protein BSLG_010538 [Batrachochytrium salamandrivorans]
MLLVSEWVQLLQSDNVQILETGLNAFVKLSRRVSTEEVDNEVSEEATFLMKWFSTSPDCSGLLRVWAYQVANSVGSLNSIVDCVAYTLSASRLVGHHSVGTNLAKEVIRNHMKDIIHNIGCDKKSLVISSLRLLGSLASHGGSITHDVMNSFNFTLKELPGLLKKRKIRKASGLMVNDIRTLLIKFILSFVISGDASVKKSLLEIKNLFTSLFAGIRNDSFDTVQFILSTIQKNVVDDPYLPRTVKIGFFPRYVLEQLLPLYSLRDKSSPTVVSPVDPTRTIADLVHEFFMYIGTTPGVGICFSDFGWYPAIIKGHSYSSISGADSFDDDGSTAVALSTPQTAKTRVHNKLLLRLLSVLRLSGNMQQRELFISILKACPELVHPFWAAGGGLLSFEPRSATRYLSNASLALQVVKLPIPTEFLGKSSLTVLAPPPISHALSNILPCLLNRALIVRTLQHSSRDIRFACASLLSSSLEKLSQVISVAKEIVVRLAASESPNAANAIVLWNKWIIELSHHLRHRIPDVQLVIVLQQQADQSDPDDSTSETDMRVTALSFIREYQKHFPELWRESRFDFGKLVSPTLSEEPMEVQKGTIAVLKEIRDFKVFSKYPKAKWTHFITLLKISTQSSDSELVSDTLELLGKILGRSFPLQDFPDYFLVFVDTLLTFLPEHQDILIEYLDTVFCSCNQNCLMISDTISRVVRGYKSRLISSGASISTAMESNILDDSNSDSVGFWFPFPPIIVSLIRSTIKDPTFGLTTLFSNACVQVVLSMSAAPYPVDVLYHLLCDDGWPLGASESNIVRLCKHWALSASVLNASTHGLDCSKKPDTACLGWKEGKAIINQTQKGDSGLVGIDPSFVSKYAVKLFSSFKTQRESIAVFAQACSPLPDAGLLSAFVELNDTDFVDRCNPLLLIPNIFGPNADDLLAGNSFIRSYFERLFSAPETAKRGRSYLCCLGASLLWMHTTVQKEKSRKKVHCRLLLCSDIIRSAINQSTSRPDTNLNQKIRRMVFSHPLFLHLYLHKIGYSVERLSGAVQPADGISMYQYVDKLWAHIESLMKVAASEKVSSSSSELRLCQLRECLPTLIPYLHMEDIDRYIKLLIAQQKRNPLQKGILLTLVSAYVSVSYHDPRARIQMQGDMFESLLLALTQQNEEASSLVAQLTGDMCGEVKSIQLYSVVSGFKIRKGMGAQSSDVCVDLPLDIWSVLSPVTLIGALESSNSSSLWNFAIKNAVTSLPHALHLLKFLKSSISTKDSKQDSSQDQPMYLWRVKTVRELLAVWTVLEPSAGGTAQWILDMPAQHIKLLARVARDVMDTELKLIESCLLGVAPGSSDDRISIATFPALILLCGSERPSEWLQSLSSKMLNATVINPELALTTLLKLWPTFSSLVLKGSQAALGDLALYVIRSVYLDKKRDHISPSLQKELYSIITRFSADDEHTAATHISSRPLVKRLFITCLKLRFKDPYALLLLRHLVARFYTGATTPEGLPSAQELLVMITSHSQFDEIMEPLTGPDVLSTATRPSPIPRFAEGKANLLRLLHQIMKTAPLSCFQPEFLPKLVRSYQGTLSPPDRATLSLLATYETRASISIAPYMGRWGSAQLDNSGVLSDGLFPNYVDPLAAINPQWMAHSLNWFSTTFEMDSFETTLVHTINNDVVRDQSALYSSGLEPLYDPNFILPLIAGYLVNTTYPLDLHRLIECNALGMAVMSLASEAASTRRLGHFILCRAYTSIRDSDMKERNQIMLLLQSLKNAIVPLNDSRTALPPPIPTVIATFCAHALMILLKPEMGIFLPVSRHLLQRSILDMRDIPLLHTLFYSTSDFPSRERAWILRMLSVGLKSLTDFRIYQRRHTIETLMSYFHSSMSDTGSCELVLEILFKAIAVPTVLVTLVIKSGLLGFLEGCCLQLDTTNIPDLLLSLTVLVHRVISGFNVAMASWSESGRDGVHLWIAQLVRLANMLVTRLADVRCESGRRKAILTLRVLQVVQAAATAASEANVSSCILSAESMNLLFTVAKECARPPTCLGRDQFAQFVQQFEDMMVHMQYAKDPYVTEQITAWTVRNLLHAGSHESGLVSFLLNDSPSALCSILRFFLTALDADRNGLDLTPSRIRPLALTGVILIARHFASIDPNHSVIGHLDPWRAQLLVSALTDMSRHVQSPHMLLKIPAELSQETLISSFEAIKLGQLVRLAICGASDDSLKAWTGIHAGMNF